MNCSAGGPVATCELLRAAAAAPCEVFTYYLQGGGCWLQGSGLQPKAIPNAVAGPRHKDCEREMSVALLCHAYLARRSCDASSIPRPSPAASPKPASPKPAAAARAPVSADAMQAGIEMAALQGAAARRSQVLTTTLMPARFIKEMMLHGARQRRAQSLATLFRLGTTSTSRRAPIHAGPALHR